MLSPNIILLRIPLSFQSINICIVDCYDNTCVALTTIISDDAIRCDYKWVDNKLMLIVPKLASNINDTYNNISIISFGKYTFDLIETKGYCKDSKYLLIVDYKPLILNYITVKSRCQIGIKLVLSWIFDNI